LPGKLRRLGVNPGANSADVFGVFRLRGALESS